MPRRRLNASVPVQTLESRCLLAAAGGATLVDGLLTVTGTSGRDTVEFADSGQVGVLLLALNRNNHFFPEAEIQRVEIYTKGGNDVIDAFGSQVPAYISSGSGSDIVDATRFDDTIVAGSGNDKVEAWAGNDDVRGSRGNDTIQGGVGDDTIRGNDGDDLIWGGLGVDKLHGNNQNDRILAGARFGRTEENVADSLYGGAGDDQLEGDGSRVVMWGSSGSDSLLGGGKLRGGSGDDLIDTGETATIRGGGGSDLIIAPNARLVYGNSGNDEIEAAGLIWGNNGRDTIAAGGMDDTVYGGNGDDEILAGLVDGAVSAVDGGPGDDDIYGGGFGVPDDSVDLLIGGDGDDTIRGGPGRDVVVGGEGEDRIIGGADDDIVISGRVRVDAGTVARVENMIPIRDVWASNLSYEDRVQEVTAGSLTFVLDPSIMRGDSATDTLFGNDGSDFFFARGDELEDRNGKEFLYAES